MNIHIGIPARYGSTRFPGKPLKDINGLTMLEHCYHRASLVKDISSVFIASADEKISNFCETKNLNYIKTETSIQRPGLRVQAAAENLNPKDDDIIVVWQGDEPLINPLMVDKAIKPLIEKPKEIFVSNMMSYATNYDLENPSEIKVVLDKNKNALFMSRASIPSRFHEEIPTKAFKQVCVMPFRWHFMKKFNYSLKPTPLELQESIEMLRAIENNYKVAMVISEFNTKSVDTQEDLDEAISIMNSDKIKENYM
jgi:3-deoxy-manno-octulosonate cytidylyltransferase (CMP-KDO synthetase)